MFNIGIITLSFIFMMCFSIYIVTFYWHKINYIIFIAIEIAMIIVTLIWYYSMIDFILRIV